MKSKLLTFAVVLLILSVAVPAMCQKPALVQDRDSQARNAYYHYLSSADTQTTQCQSTCWIDFPAVPAGKRLIVQQVSVYVDFVSANASAPASMELRAVSASIGISESAPFIAALNNYGTHTFYFARMPVQVPYDAGQAPRVATYSPSGNKYYMTVSISGYMIDMP